MGPVSHVIEAVSALARVGGPGLTPVYYSGRLVWKLQQLAIAAGFKAGPVAYNHAWGRHSFTVEIEGRTHRVTVEPDQAEMDGEMAVLRGEAA